MTTWSGRVGASSDDAYQLTPNGDAVLTGHVRFVGNGNGTGICGFRFTNVTVPQGTTITSATLILTAQATYDSGANRIAGIAACQAADNPGTFISTAGSKDLGATARPRTTAKATTWQLNSVTAEQTYSKDITSCVQEVLNRAGFASGNAIVVLIDDDASASLEWQDMYSYDDSTTKCALLEIVYSAAEPQTVSLAAAAITASPQGATVSAPPAGLSVSLNAASLGAVTQGMTAVPGAVSSALATAALSAAAQAATAGNFENLTVSLAAAILTAAPQPVIPSTYTLITSHEIDVGNGYMDGTATQVARTSDDRLWVVSKKFDYYPWGDNVDGKQYPMRVYKADQTGIPTTFSLMDAAHAPAAPQSWAVAVGADDDLYILWVERSSEQYASNLKFCIFDTSAGTYGSVTTIDNALGITDECGQGDDLCAIAVDENGAPHIVYAKSDGTRRRVNYRNKTSGSWSAATIVDDQSFGATQKIHHPGICFDNSGRIVVSWVRGSDESSTDGRAFVRVYSGGSWGTGHDISGSNIWPGIDTALRIYVDPDNRWHVAFLNASKQIRYYYSDDLGATWTANHPGGGDDLGDDPTVGPYYNGKVRLYAHNDPAVDTKISYYEGTGGPGAWGARTVYNTTSGMDCSVNVRWSQYYHVSSHVDIAYWRSTYPTNELYVGSDVMSTVVSLDSATLSAAAQGITTSTGIAPTTVTLGAAALSAGAQACGITPGAVTTSLAAASLASQARLTTTVPGAVSVALNAAGLIASGQSCTILPGAVTTSLAAAALIAEARTAPVVPGAATVSLGAAALLANPQGMTAVPGPVTISLNVTNLVTVPEPLSFIIYPVTINLAAATLTASPQALTLAAQTTVSLAVADLQASAQGVSVSTIVACLLGAATLSAQAQPASAIPGAVTVALEPVGIVTEAQDIAIDATVYVPLGEAVLAISTQGTTVISGPVSIPLGAAILIATARQVYGPTWAAETPDERVYGVAVEDRIYVIGAENRVYTISWEDRTVIIE